MGWSIRLSLPVAGSRTVTWLGWHHSVMAVLASPLFFHSTQQLSRRGRGLPMVFSTRSRYLSKTVKSCLYVPSGCFTQRTMDSSLLQSMEPLLPP